MSELPFHSATALAAAIRARKIGCRELLDIYLERVDRFNPKLNAIVAMDLDCARRRSEEADAALVRGEYWGPLHGVPVTVKESLDVAGMPTTWGNPALKNHYPAQDAVAVSRLKAAGAVLFGKTNVPLNLADWQSYNAVYGTTNNPWNPSLSPGGSSGGSAAALAAGLTGLELGTDIGGSIRNPAHYCGIYGHRPTYGLVPLRGHSLKDNVAGDDMSVIGPMARHPDDLETCLRAIAGPDDIDGAAWHLSLTLAEQKCLGDFRVAVMLNDPIAEVDRTVQDGLQSLADFLARQGTVVSDCARPDIDSHFTHGLFLKLLRAAMSGRHSAEMFRKNLDIAEGISAEDQSYPAVTMRGFTLHHRDWLLANEERHRLRVKWAAFFQNYDVLLCPAAATAAVAHDQKGDRHERAIRVNGKDVSAIDQLFWAGYPALAYLPSTTAPVGLTDDGLPTGVQIIARQYGDFTAIRIAQLLERKGIGFSAPPEYE